MKNKQRPHRRSEKRHRPHTGQPPAPVPAGQRSSGGGWLRPALLGAGLLGVVALVLWQTGMLPFGHTRPRSSASSGQKTADARDALDTDPEPEEDGAEKSQGEQHGTSPHKKKPTGEFLSDFDTKGSEEKEGGPAPTSKELEKTFLNLRKLQDQLQNLRDRARADPHGLEQNARRALAEVRKLVKQVNKSSAAFEKDLARARKARPQDPVTQWLTGELLCSVQGEPDEILPFLERAVAGGLVRAELFGTLAKVQLEANQFARAYQSAVRALQRSSRSRRIWDTYTRVALANEKFTELSDQVKRSFPADPPYWAEEMSSAAGKMQALWQEEQKLRAAEKRANDLPRVRFTIQHRRFAAAPEGGQPTQIENTGPKEEVILELFEDQAPATVANFIDLVARGFYDGTRFHLAMSAKAVLGGDPNSKTINPSKDGTGGPGYVIPDEFKARNARNHFRGTLSMYNTGPHTAGSQFLITLVPAPALNGHQTAFGRVIKGQEVLDRITQGRTNREVANFGRIIPGDLLVRAEVIRKRPHEYPVQKEKAEDK